MQAPVTPCFTHWRKRSTITRQVPKWCLGFLAPTLIKTLRIGHNSWPKISLAWPMRHVKWPSCHLVAPHKVLPVKTERLVIDSKFGCRASVKIGATKLVGLDPKWDCQETLSYWSHRIRQGGNRNAVLVTTDVNTLDGTPDWRLIKRTASRAGITR